MAYKRSDIFGTSPLDIKNLNDNIKNLWFKVFGDISLGDMQTDVKDMLYSNWLQPQGEGNLDASNPLEIRFYVPPNTKRVNTAKLNLIASKYRVDSDVTSTSDTQTPVAIVTTGQSNIDTSPVDKWGPYQSIGTPTQPTTGAENILGLDPVSDGFIADGYYTQTGSGGTLLMAVAKAVIEGSTETYAWVDMYRMQHRHNIQHTHSGSANITIEGHSHTLNMGIKKATNILENIKVYIVNSGGTQDMGVLLNETNLSVNEVDIVDKIKIGEWNTIQITSTNLARVTAFGIVELLQNY